MLDQDTTAGVRFDVVPRQSIDSAEPVASRLALVNDEDRIVFEDTRTTVVEAISGDGVFFENTLTHTRSYRCVGRLLHEVSGKPYLGSAFAVGPRLIMSAAHNFHAGPGGEPYSNFLFQPGYPAMARSISIERFYVPNGWIKSGGVPADMAFAVTAEVIWPDLWYGVYTRVDDPKGWAIYGYPSEGRFDGELPFGDSGSSTNKPWRSGDLRFSTMACDRYDLAGGVSGGPWIGGDFPQPPVKLIAHGGGQESTGAYAGGLHSGTFKRARDCAASPQFGVILEQFFKTIRSELPLPY